MKKTSIKLSVVLILGINFGCTQAQPNFARFFSSSSENSPSSAGAVIPVSGIRPAWDSNPSGLAQMPRQFIDSDTLPIPKRSYTVTSDLQSAIDSALPGDEIILPANSEFKGNFTLPAKGGSDWITIRSSNLSQLAQAKRVSPSDSTKMARIISPNGSPAIAALAGV